MKTADPALVTFLNAVTDFVMTDLYTITLVDGTVLRWVNWNEAITLPGDGRTFQVNGPGVTRGQTRLTSLLEVDTLDVTLLVGQVQPLINGVALIAAMMNGAFDAARVRVERLFMPTPTDYSLPPLMMFEGRVAGIDHGSTEIQLRVKSDLELLNVRLPRVLFQPGCSNSLFDAACGLVKSGYTHTGTVYSATGSKTVVRITKAAPLVNTDAWYDLGVLAFTSGPLAGVRRSVQSWVAAGGGAYHTVTLGIPLPVAPEAGDGVSVYPGCDKTKTMCGTKYVNINRFRGFPFVPRPEQAR